MNKGTQLSPSSKLYHLDALVNLERVLKVGRRLCDVPLPSSVKHPMIIPKDHYIPILIISQCHENVKHQGKGLTINEIRSQGYWIPGISRAVYYCVTCRKLRRPTEEQRMADLPSEHTNPSPPFTYCDMDCFGPFVTKQGRKEHKRFSLHFNGLRSFVALRGAVRQIKCDQGTSFVGAKNELKKALKEII